IPAPSQPASAAPAPTSISKMQGNKTSAAWTSTVAPLIDQLSRQMYPNDPTTAATTAAGIKANAGTAYFLQPGRYDRSITYTNASDLVFFAGASAGSGGIYYLNGGLSANNASLVMDPRTSGGMMFYNAGTGNSQNISISGSPTGVISLKGLDALTSTWNYTVTLTPAGGGAAYNSDVYEGFLIFQNRSSSQAVSITGNGNFTMTGTFYAANAELKVTGNGALSVIGAQYVSKTLTTGGNGTVNVDYTSRTVPAMRRLELVEAELLPPFP
ncbi:MAG: hypothetical protein LC745_05815, partial [Planctomycetia bacterium]|nr:hypothetical protein [Planctomycetia bacterium]